MAQLQLFLFGTFAARWGDQPVTRFPTDKVRALLAYIALNGKRPLRRETLATLFWPDYSDSVARRNLRQNLHRLNQLLDGLTPGLSQRLLTITRQTIAINEDALWLDVIEFDKMITAVTHHPHAQRHTCPTCLNQLTQAASLINGDLLAGFTLPDAPLFDEWLIVERERLHYQSLQLLHTLAEASLHQHAYDQAHHYAARQISLEPWREEAHRQMILALARQGRRSEALAQYATCCRVLEEELGIAPTDDTVTLYNDIVGENLPPIVVETAVSLHHFPPTFSPFIGRQTEYEQIISHLTNPACRLLTLVGPGGMGKTRLATHAIQHTYQQKSASLQALFPHGCYFVPLAEATSQEHLVQAIAQALALPPAPAGKIAAQLETYLQDKKLLLLLDNFEQLSPAALFLHQLLTAAPGLKLLVTSRAPLAIQAEWLLRLDGLPYPTATNQEAGLWQDYSALQLFSQAAQRVQPDFQVDERNLSAIIHICHLTEGMPLALELAAAWLRLLPCTQIADQIGRNLDFLQTEWPDLPPRHRSMRAMFQQSWDFLGEQAQRVLAQLSVFSGSFSVEAALAVTEATLPLLLQLLDKSLVQRQENGRFALHKLIQQFAAEQLALLPDQQQATLRRHSQHYLELVQGYGAALHGPQAISVIHDLRLTQANLVTAWQTAVQQQQWPLIEACLDSFTDYHLISGQLNEVSTLLAAAIEATAATAVSPLAAYLRLNQARILIEQGYLPAAADRLAQVAQTELVQTHPRLLARLQLENGRLQELQSSYDEALTNLTSALSFYQQSGNRLRQAQLIGTIGNVYWRQYRLDEALTNFHRALAMATEIGDQAYQAILLSDIGIIYVDKSDFSQGLHYYEQALAIDKALGNQAHVARHTHNIARVYRLQGKFDLALTYFKQAAETAVALGLRRGASLCLTNMGIVAKQLGQYGQAEAYYQQALQISQELNLKEGIANNWGNLANLYRLQGKFTTARTYYEQAITLSREIGYVEGEARHIGDLAELHKDLEEWPQARQLFEQAITLFETIEETYCLSSVLILQTEVLLELADYETAAALLAKGITLTQQSERADFLFRGQLLTARLAWLQGAADEAMASLNGLLATHTKPEEQALLYDHLWQIGQAPAHRQRAIGLYGELYGRIPNIQYQKRLDQLQAVPLSQKV